MSALRYTARLLVSMVALFFGSQSHTRVLGRISAIGASKKSAIRYTPRLIVSMVLLFLGSVGHTYVLYAVDDWALRLRLAFLCTMVIAWSLIMAPSAADVARREEAPARRRFFRMRRAIDDLINEATRLNWIVLDAQRDQHVRRKRKPEIDAVKQDMRQLLEEIFQSAGQVAHDAESDAPFEPRFQSSPSRQRGEHHINLEHDENEQLTG